ncbi:hypothetical protein PENCOP_c013G02517 [Penicillium coprophilum]|uniref:Zn(2)-C6 fungal-type domain-containing protein n=1 Tax=Penicillium coprophilum TaxID=36646 RepID=A0A1V6UBQ2_9EURO|nr:hypothetical protein PENCOP_c013G02517 [Penicillium coprophilum]
MSPVDEETIQARRHRLSSVPRACEGCKIRKIRCDRTRPCANCRTSNISCRYPNDKSRSQQDKAANREAHEDRLEKRLRSLESRITALERSKATPVIEDATILDVSSPEPRPTDESPLFEGDPSFTNQSFQASESARRTVVSACNGDNSAIDHSFNQLQKCLRASQGLSRNDFYFRKSTSQAVPTSTPLPVNLVTYVLRRMRDRRPIFLSSYAISDLSVVENLCEKVYSTSELASVGEIASMHGVLFFVLKELIAMKDPLCQKFDLATSLDHCEKNFVDAIETYEVLAVPSFESILALTMGMIKSQGEAKPYLYWKLVAAAVSHCESLGYHRKSTYQNFSSSKAESIRRLFWTVYTFDKNMSLVLGRASHMQSLGIDSQYPTVSTDLALRAWDESFVMGIRLAELQGRIFADLYSTTTMAKAPSERAQIISDLSAAMEKWHLELEQIDSEGVNNPHVFHLSRGNWDILFYSTLTLLFHASSTNGVELQISSHCFNAARNSLRAHLDFFPQYQKSQLLSDDDYFNWVLLSSSFIPFIVTFLHTIAAKDMANVTLLEQVVGTLENFRSSSQGSERLYQICATFTQVARKLVQSQQSPVGSYNQQQNSLRISDTSHGTSLFPPEVIQDTFGSSDLNSVNPYAIDILNDWLSGPPFPWDKIDVDFDNSHSSM